MRRRTTSAESVPAAERRALVHRATDPYRHLRVQEAGREVVERDRAEAIEELVRLGVPRPWLTGPSRISIGDALAYWAATGRVVEDPAVFLTRAGRARFRLPGR